ncbi:MAG TPA: glycoside hydrolase family 9 protein [Pyrinomonadaceae bacterium]|nr:glycoside hydrolase family 9 protein [Pyrinomonadaceae bacterium]
MPNKKNLTLPFLCLSLVLAPLTDAQDATGPRVRLDTVGYLPGRDKRATLPAPCGDFRVVSESNGRVVFKGRASGPRRNRDTDEDLCVADFSALKTPGVYRLEADGARASHPFEIDDYVYRSPFAVALRAMYLWRCGAAVRAEHGGTFFSHDACHTEDARLDFVGGGAQTRDATGGWHDAGDYNKYVVNAGVTVGIMLRAWEEFGPRIRKVKPDIPPEDPLLHAFLAEIKWETDWLLKMQAPDGSVYHKVSTEDFGPAIMPEEEKTARFFTPQSTAAAADFAAMLASAARAFKPFHGPYAARCLAAARRAYDFLKANPQSKRADLSGFTTGPYQTDDSDDRLWAAAELWETTGEARYLSDFETRASTFQSKFSQDWGWGDVKNLGMLAYLFSKRAGRDARLVRGVRASLLETADRIVAVRDGHGYARPLTRYYWGANGGVANAVLLLRAADRIAPRRAYVETALDALHHLFGRNLHGRSYVTGLGFDPPRHPHDRRSMARPGSPPWPGYLVGGGWPKPSDWVDDADNYRVNEIAINWNAPLIYALAAFL